MNNYEENHINNIEKGKLIGLHFNSHKNTYSIVEFKSKRTEGKVIGYTDKAILKNAYTVIRKSGQEQVKNSCEKNRHAYIVGEFDSFESDLSNNELYYNPYKVNGFVDKGKFKQLNIIEEVEKMKSVSFDIIKEDHSKKPIVTYKI